MTFIIDPFRFGGITRSFDAPASWPEATSGSLAFVSLPPGDAGQLLVVQIGFRGTAAFTMPSGWTQIAQVTTADTAFGARVSGLMAWKIRGASEPVPTFTRTGGGFAAAAMTGYTAGAGGLTFDTHSVLEQATATTNFAGAALTVSQPGSLLVTTAVVSGQDDSLAMNFSAAGLSKAPTPVGLPAASEVSTTTWGQTFFARINLGTFPFNGVTTLGADVADVPAGSTGAFAGTSTVSCRTLVMAAAFRRT